MGVKFAMPLKFTMASSKIAMTLKLPSLHARKLPVETTDYPSNSKQRLNYQIENCTQMIDQTKIISLLPCA